MHIDTCPNCAQRVVFCRDGTCPACRADARLGPPHPALGAQDAAEAGEQLAVDCSLQTQGRGTDAEELPDIGLLGGFGWLLLLWCAQLSMGCYLGVYLGFSGLSELLRGDADRSLMVSLAFADAIMFLIAWLQLAPGWKQKLGLHKPSELHLLLVLLLVLPLSILCESVGQFAGLQWDAMTGDAVPGQLTMWAEARHAPTVAYTGVFDALYNAIANQPWPVMVLIGCLLPGACEEVFFRGFLGQGMIRRYGVVGGVLTTSLLFGLFHLDPVQACYTFLVGIVLHCVYLWTRSLWAPMLLHLLFNFVGFTLTKLQNEGSLVFGGPDEQFRLPPALIAASAVTLLVLLIVLFQSRVRRAPAARRQSPDAARSMAADQPPTPDERPRPQQAPRMWSVSAALVCCLVFGLLLVRAASVWFDPDSAMAHLYRAYDAAMQEDYAAAVAAYSRAIDANPELADAYVGRGEAYRMLGELDRALEDCNQALQIAPESSTALADRGETHRLLGKLNEAIDDCDRAIKLDPELSWAWSVRGSAYSDNGDWRRAITDLRSAVRLDPEHFWSHYLLALELVHCPESASRDLHEAIHQARTACELSEWADADMIALLAQIYAMDGQFDEAVRTQREALRAASDDEKPFFREQLTAYEQGQIEIDAPAK